MIFNPLGYVCRTRSKRSWFLVKCCPKGRNNGVVEIKEIRFPPGYIGKRVKIKIEVIED